MVPVAVSRRRAAVMALEEAQDLGCAMEPRQRACTSDLEGLTGCLALG